jgi:hypothetical protein
MKRSHRYRRPSLEQLEPRCLLNAANPLGTGQQLHPPGCGCPFCSGGLNHTPADLRTEPSGLQFFYDPMPVLAPGEIIPQAATTVAGSGTLAAASGSLTAPILHSNPGATKKIFLDFDGQVVSGTDWNKYNGGRAIHAPAYDIDGNIFSFSSAEIANITEIWRRVSEDYSPFNVDVTTQDPGLSALTAGGQAIRVLITSNRDEAALGGTGKTWYSSAGGITYLNSWSWTSDTPAWVFENNLGNGNEKYVAEAASHETGHSFGLKHDGTSSSEYYSGQGSGETGWAPIMGVSYYRPVTQWSKGEYSGANNTQDDVGILAAALGYRPDDHGNTMSTAARLTPTSTGSISAAGIISTRTDVDEFSFTTGSGPVTFAISPVGLQDSKGDLDVLARLYNSSGQMIASSNPADALDAAMSMNLSAGTYYLQIDGAGAGDPGATGYSDYGSLGQYTITGSIMATSTNSAPIAVDDGASTEVDKSILINVLANDRDADQDRLSIASLGTPSNGRVSVESGGIRYTPNSGFRGTDTFTYTVSDGRGGVDSATVTVTMTAATGILNFANRTILDYGGTQDFNGSATATSSGSGLALKGNTWKAIALNYNVTSNTVLEFDFSSSAQGDIHGIGLDNDVSYTSSRTFQLYGTQSWGIRDFDTYPSGTLLAKHYVIPVGQYYIGSVHYLFFINDHDVSNPTAQSLFSNVKLYERATLSAPLASSTSAKAMVVPAEASSAAPDAALPSPNALHVVESVAFAAPDASWPHGGATPIPEQFQPRQSVSSTDASRRQANRQWTTTENTAKQDTVRNRLAHGLCLDSIANWDSIAVSDTVLEF